MSTEMRQPDVDPAIKATAATFRYLASWFGTEKERAHLLEIALDVEATEGHEACCPVCQEVTCDRGCPLEPLRDRCQSEPLSQYRKQHDARTALGEPPLDIKGDER